LKKTIFPIYNWISKGKHKKGNEIQLIGPLLIINGEEYEWEFGDGQDEVEIADIGNN